MVFGTGKEQQVCLCKTIALRACLSTHPESSWHNSQLVFAQLQTLEQAARSCCGCGVWRACAPALFTKGEDF